MFFWLLKFILLIAATTVLSACAPFHEGGLLPGDLLKLGKITPDEQIGWNLIRWKVLARCLDCHSGRVLPTLLQGDQVREHLTKILLEVERGSMPPARATFVPLSSCQKAILKRWAKLLGPEESNEKVADLVACNVEEPPKPDLKVLPLNFENLKTQILGPRCAHCHSAGSTSSAKSLPFENYESIANDPRGRWNAPGSTSRIVRSLTRTDKFRMPPASYADALSAEEIDFIVRWIDAGKPAQ